MVKKDNNPKDAIGIKKAPFSTVPAPVIAEVGLAMMEGARKYGRHNYRAIGARASVYYDACFRHLTQFWEGEDIDPDSGIHHLAQAIACLAVIRDSQMIGNWTDDRPPKHKDGWVNDMNEHAEELINRHPVPLEPFTQLNRNGDKKD